MTLYAIGDYHGRSIQQFLDREQPTSEDTVLSTGDFDQVSVIHELLDLKDEIGDNSVKDVAGNHDEALLNNRRISSGSIKSQFKKFEDLAEELQQDERAKKYVQSLLKKEKEEFSVGRKNGVLIHGGFEGHLQNPSLEEELRPLWYRLWEEEDFKSNFDIMEEQGYDIMIRGHDHWTEHAVREKGGSEISYNLPNNGATYDLNKDNLHIVTTGSWFEGKYVAINEDSLELDFRSI